LKIYFSQVKYLSKPMPILYNDASRTVIGIVQQQPGWGCQIIPCSPITQKEKEGSKSAFVLMTKTVIAGQTLNAGR
jgi:hypothetical protein